MTWEAAFISAVTALLVVILTNGLGVLLESRRRREKTLDYVCALHAEIVAGMDTAARQTADDEAAYFENDQTPFAVADETDFVFESIRSDLTILPVEVVHAVVVYYKLSQRSILLTRALGTSGFQRQDPSAKRKFVLGLLGLLDDQQVAARSAIAALEDFAKRNGRDLRSRYDRGTSSMNTPNRVASSGANNRNDGTTHG